MRRLLVSLVLLLAASPARGQLHFVAGSPPDSNGYTFAAAIFRVEVDGSVKRVVTLVPQRDGIDWIGVSYDWRKLVIFPKIGAFNSLLTNSVTVVDFSNPTAVKQCIRPHSPGLPGEVWLDDSPAHGPSVVWNEINNTSADIFDGMVLDMKEPCSKSMWDVTPQEIQNATVGGTGSYLWTPQGQPEIGIDKDGTIFGIGPAPSHPVVPMSRKAPAELAAFPKFVREHLDVSDSRVTVFSQGNDAGACRVIALRKRDESWHVIPLTVTMCPSIRGFGRYIAMTESELPTAAHPRSAGIEEWKKGNREFGPDLNTVAQEGRIILTGKLDIYDIETGKLSKITTNQGDSEVLLVDGGFAYWRVANRLYSAPITDAGIGTPRLLATDESIRDAHYAFMK